MKQSELPPAGRTRMWQALSAAAARKELVLPRCRSCGLYQYPLRELCRRCLADELEWTPVPGEGTLLSWTVLHASVERFFQSRVPWPVAQVKLACGPVVIAHLRDEAPASGKRLHVHNRLDRNGCSVLVAAPPGADPERQEAFASLLSG